LKNNLPTQFPTGGWMLEGVNMKILKFLTSNKETVNMQTMNEKSFNFKEYTKLIFATSNLPEEAGYRRRREIIYFDQPEHAE
jgi:hypothetical protein